MNGATKILTAALGVLALAAPALAVEQKPPGSERPAGFASQSAGKQSAGKQPAAKQPAAKQPAAKQTTGKQPAPAQAAPQAAPGDASPPYEGQLLRLSEIMGALAYLRDLCGDGDAAEYRAKMAALLDAEATAQDRREKLAGAFNRGYRGYETTYRTCTPNARTVISRFVAEGGRIARDISYRFGGA